MKISIYFKGVSTPRGKYDLTINFIENKRQYYLSLFYQTHYGAPTECSTWLSTLHKKNSINDNRNQQLFSLTNFSLRKAFYEQNIKSIKEKRMEQPLFYVEYNTPINVVAKKSKGILPEELEEHSQMAEAARTMLTRALPWRKWEQDDPEGEDNTVRELTQRYWDEETHIRG
jgi:hypothetical protein